MIISYNNRTIQLLTLEFLNRPGRKYFNFEFLTFFDGSNAPLFTDARRKSFLSFSWDEENGSMFLNVAFWEWRNKNAREIYG